MKTLTLRNIPQDVQLIIHKEKYWGEPATKTIYRLIYKFESLKEEIEKYKALNKDSKT